MFIRVDQWSKTMSHLKTGVQCNTENYVPIVVLRLSTTSSSGSSATETSLPQEGAGSTPIPASIESERTDEQGRDNLSPDPTKNPKPNKNEDHEQERVTLSNSEKPEWLQEFRDNLVEESVPEPHGSHASSIHEPSLEPLRRVVPGNHSVCTHFTHGRRCSSHRLWAQPARYPRKWCWRQRDLHRPVLYPIPQRPRHTAAGVEYTFIQTRFHPLTRSSKHDFIQWHFHPNTISSNDTFIQNTFIQFWHFHPILTLSSNDTLNQDSFIQQQFRPMNFSSNDIFIQWHFQPITVSSKKKSHVVQSI